MKKLKCSDLGADSDYHFEAEGETNQEIIDKMFVHTAESHL